MAEIKIIFGAGYGGRALGVFIETLIKNKIERLVDIRTFPVSRHFPQFSKEFLSKALANAEIKYKHEGRRIGGKLPNVGYEEAIDELSELVKGGMKICLMCAESKSEECHRTTVLKPSFAERKIELVEIKFPKKTK